MLMYLSVACLVGVVTTVRDGSYGFTAAFAVGFLLTAGLSWTGVRWFRGTKGV